MFPLASPGTVSDTVTPKTLSLEAKRKRGSLLVNLADMFDKCLQEVLLLLRQLHADERTGGATPSEVLQVLPSSISLVNHHDSIVFIFSIYIPLNEYLLCFNIYRHSLWQHRSHYTNSSTLVTVSYCLAYYAAPRTCLYTTHAGKCIYITHA